MTTRGGILYQIGEAFLARPVSSAIATGTPRVAMPFPKSANRWPRIKFVTLTGADNTVAPGALLGLSTEYPFAEWGILVSDKHTSLPDGSPRFPSWSWLQRLQSSAANLPLMNLSLHICGNWVKSLLLGRVTFPVEMLNGFQRVQLNFHAKQDDYDEDKFRDALAVFGPREIIFQIDGGDGARLLETTMIDGGPPHVPLFDLSGGAGIVPDQWPRPEYLRGDVNCNQRTCRLHGYAGGLGPDNLVVEVPRIFRACEASGLEVPEIWVDMETKLRTTNGDAFDLAACRNVLSLLKPFA